MTKEQSSKKPEQPFNYAIYLYEMNADTVFEHTQHIIVDSSLGLVDEDSDYPDEA